MWPFHVNGLPSYANIKKMLVEALRIQKELQMPIDNLIILHDEGKANTKERRISIRKFV